MKQLLLLICLCTTFWASAQQLTLEPTEVVVMGVDAGDFEGVAHSTVTNVLPQLKTYRWVRTTIDATEGWANAVCDKNQCYLPTVDSMDFELAPSESGLIDVHAYPNGVAGSTVVEVSVFDPLSPVSSAVTGLYYFNTMPVSTDEQTIQQLRVYPNPTTGIFTLDNREVAGDIIVYSLTGQPLRRFVAADSPTYDIRDLPQGAYILRLVDDAGRTLINRMIQKQ